MSCTGFSETCMYETFSKNLSIVVMIKQEYQQQQFCLASVCFVVVLQLIKHGEFLSIQFSCSQVFVWLH